MTDKTFDRRGWTVPTVARRGVDLAPSTSDRYIGPVSDIERTPKVFISYRRDDAPAHAGRVADHLRAAFGEGSVFMDVESIGAGAEFARDIDDAIRGTDAELVVIGPGWLDARTADGKRRLDQDNDFVRAEIVAGLASNIRVIPILVGGAFMPPRELLPEPIAELASRNAFELLDRRWREDVEALVDVLRGRVTACPNCGQENSTRAVFCMACGSSLQEQAPARELRKVVTVMACEASVSGEEEIDPEDARALLGPIRELVRVEVERFGGTVERSLGNTIVSVFGALVAHEDDAERAVRSALRILDADSGAEDDSVVTVRAAIQTGEALVQPGARTEMGEELIAGDVVNRSLRLLLRSTEAVLVGQQTYEATQDLFVYEEAGIDEGPRGGRIFRTSTARSSFGTDLTTKHATPLVGRNVDLTLLRSAFDKTLAGSNVQLVTIVGEPGVGKSRLLSELFAYTDDLEELVRWRQGRCLPYGDGITFWALGEIVKAHAGILESDDPATAGSKIDAIVPDSAQDAPWLRQRLRPLVGLDAPGAEREENFGAWRAFIESLANDGPAVIVFEDLHWADEAMLSFIRDAVDPGSDVPLLVVALARPELYSRAPDWAGGLRNATTINLDPLSEADTAKLVADLLGQAVLPLDVQRVVLERAGGNPLYAEEFVRLLKDREILVERAGSWRLEPGATISMPVGVQALIASRIDALQGDEQALLQDAAVVGKVFWAGALAHITGRPTAEIERDLQALGRRELVRASHRSSIEGEAEYAFWHALVRDVCYGQIPKRSRADKHVAAATWIQGIAGEREEDLAEILAAHYDAALQASGNRASPEIRERTTRYLRLAGDRALGLDPATAERNFSRALELLSPEDPARPDVLVRYGEALTGRAQYVDALAAFDEAIRSFQQQGDERAATVAALRSVPAMGSTGDPRARQVVRAAVAELSKQGTSPELVEALSFEAGERSLSDGDHDGGVEAADRALKMANDLGIAVPVRALRNRGTARTNKGDMGGLEDYRRAADLAQEQGLGRDRLGSVFNLLLYEADIEGTAQALQGVRDGLAESERYGIEDMTFAFKSLLISGLIDDGSWDEALALAEELIPVLEAHDDVWSLVPLRTGLAALLTDRGEPQAAEPLASWVLDRVREMDEHQALAGSLFIRLYVAERLGDRATAASLLHELVERCAGENGVIWWLDLAALTAVRLDEKDLARQLIESITPAVPAHEMKVNAGEAVLAESDGDLPRAVTLFQAAEAFAERLGSTPTRAFSLLGLGRSLMGTERTADATVALEDARKLFVSMGAKPWVAETDALLQRLRRDAS
jgi:tetratricopeptide (TPR) repeat protein